MLPLQHAGVLSDVLNYLLEHAHDVAFTQPTTPAPESEPKRKVSAAAYRKARRKTVRAGFGDRPASMQSVFAACFKFLKALARKNLEVQQRYVCALLNIPWGKYK